MGCGCGGSGVQQVTSAMVPGNTLQNQTVDSTETCPYTREQVERWTGIVLCARDTAAYTQIEGMTQYQVNLYLGTLLSVQNYRGNPCYFEARLQEVETFITILTAMDLCTTLS